MMKPEKNCHGFKNKKTWVQNLLICLMIGFSLIACSSAEQSPLPKIQNVHQTKIEKRLVWVGTGKSYKYQNGKWHRTPTQDYEFSVIQDRKYHFWESIKEMHRRHPEYDGTAGDRDQTYYFRVDYEPALKQNRVAFLVRSGLGNGKGTTDPEFRSTIMELKANISSFAPYNRFRIKQKYMYEKGLLVETVELFKQSDDGRELPFVKIEEFAKIFVSQPLKTAPTIWKDYK